EAASDESLLDSYRRLADVFHDILAEQSLDTLLDRIADTLAELIPYDTLTIYEVDVHPGELVPVLARDKWADKILNARIGIGEGITGWAAQHREAVLVNQAHLDPRMRPVPGTPPDEAEALMCIPLIARGAIKGTLNLYRLGESASFSEVEFEVAKRFGDAAALALDNAQIRARLEHQAQTDSLTGLYNHRAFHDRLRQELQRASRSHDSVALLMLDIDDFKRVNDVYGHGTGDEVLRSLASTLRGAVRGSDVVCRLGGEEFGVILPGCDEALALSSAERVTQTLSTFEVEAAGRITISVGLAYGPEHATSAKTAIDVLSCKVGEGITGRVAETGESLLIGDAAHYEYARQVPGTDVIEETQINVPLRYGSRVIGVVGISKLGLDQFDEDD